MKIRIIKILILILIQIFMTFINSQAQSQNYIIDGVTQVATSTDSIFYKFVKPTLPSKFIDSTIYNKNYDFFSMSFFICANIDNLGKVKNIIIQPIYLLHNDLSDTSYIWKYVINSIDSVSKLWVFKPLYHKILSEYSEEQKSYYNKVNKGEFKATHRPFFGKQIHMFVLNITLPCYSVTNPNMFYFINLDYNELYKPK